MNYQYFYDKIINNAKSLNRVRTKENYYENHHIVPRCLGGNDDNKNLVLLTAKEHYICHKLLTYIHKKDRKIACAFYRMTFSKKIGLNLSSRDYAYARELLHNIPVSDETIKKMKAHKFSEQHRKHISESLRGLKQSEETKEKRASKHRGRKNTEETKLKMSLKSLGRKKNYTVWNKGKTNLNITTSMIKDIKNLYSLGKFQKEIANEYKLSTSCIARIINGFYDNRVEK